MPPCRNETKSSGASPRAWGRRLLLLAAVVGLALWWLQGSERPAMAHANIADARPAPNSVLETAPETVIAWFTEPVEAGLSEIRVLDSSGARVDRGDTTVDPNDPTAIFVGLEPLPNGTYTVAWRNVSTVDGHLVRGSFLFSVGEPLSAVSVEAPGQPLFQSPWEPVVRWAILIAALAVVGGLSFDLLVLRPALLDRRASPGGQARRGGGRLARPAGRLAGHGALGPGLRGPAPPSGREHVREVVVGRPRRTGLVDSDGDRVGSPVAVAHRAHPGLLGRPGGRLRALPARFGRPRRTRRLPPAGPGAGTGGGRRGAGHAQPDEPRRGDRGDRDRRGGLRPPSPVGVGVLDRSAIPSRAGTAASDEGAAGPGAAGGAVEDDSQVLRGGRAQRRYGGRHRHLRGLGAGDRLGRFRDAVRSGADRQDHVGRRAAGPGRREPRLGTPAAVEGRRRGGLAQASRRRRGGAGGGCARRGRRPHEPGAGPSGRVAGGHRGPGQPRVPGRRGGRGDRPDDRSGRRRSQRGGRVSGGPEGRPDCRRDRRQRSPDLSRGGPWARRPDRRSARATAPTGSTRSRSASPGPGRRRSSSDGPTRSTRARHSASRRSPAGSPAAPRSRLRRTPGGRSGPWS